MMHAAVPMQMANVRVGTRTDGVATARRIHDAILDDQEVILDFTDVSIVGSGWADEALGKTVLEAGFVQFNQHVRLANMNGKVKALIERAILWRMVEGTVERPMPATHRS